MTAPPADANAPPDAAPPPENSFVPLHTLPAGTRFALALQDLRRSAGMWELWSTLGWYDIQHRYRRSKIGPFWITISMGIFVGSLGILYAALFQLPIAEYMPYLACGFLIWNLIGGAIEDGTTVYINAGQTITQVRAPLYIHVLRTAWRNLLIFAHNAAVPVVVLTAFGMWPGAAGLLVFPGLLLVALNGLWISGLLGLVCARFRDVPQIVSSLLHMAFLLTPVIWKKELLEDRAAFAEMNPFYHLVELVRRPLLGGVPDASSYLVALGAAALGWTAMLLLHQRYRNRVAFWV